MNELSYQQARNNRAAVGQVYVAEPGEPLARCAQVLRLPVRIHLGGRHVPVGWEERVVRVQAGVRRVRHLWWPIWPGGAPAHDG